MKESLLFDKIDGGKVRCNVCAVRCVIPQGGRGACFTRLNRDGTLYSLIYGRVSSAFLDPIEKKPVYHFLPGSRIFSMGSLGCNFHCPGCQNWEISHESPADSAFGMHPLTPEQAVEEAVRGGARGICWTYNDPTIWLEYTLEGARLAKSRGLYTAYITNGYATPEHLELIAPHLDIWRVDIKGFSRETYKKISGLARFEPVLEMAERAKHHYKLHVECVTNVTPGISDSDETLRGIASWIREKLGPETPWHVTRFVPYLQLSHVPPTPLRTLERAIRIGKEAGLNYVYIGNIPGHPSESTYCPGCGDAVIERSGYSVPRVHLKDGRCPACRTEIPGRWG